MLLVLLGTWPPAVVALLFVAFWVFQSSWQPLSDAITVNALPYTVIGRVARRIWAVAMKEKYGANERSQKLKYHIQTSGRSLHAGRLSLRAPC